MKRTTTLVVLAIVLAAAAMGAAAIGVVSIPLDAIGKIIWAKLTHGTIAEEWKLFETTLFTLRLPRIALSILAGAALAMCGAVFQSIFRNPICDPYILGISSGASLGAAFAIIAGLDFLWFGTTLCALPSALLTLVFVLTIARLGNCKSVETILLAGVAINFLISAIITLLMVLNQESMEEIMFWTMGSFAAATWSETGILLAIVAAVGIFLLSQSKKLNLLQLGGDIAQTSGVNTQRSTQTILMASSLLVAVVVAFCGVIGFVGLIVPHIVRLLWGNDMRKVLPYSILLGAIFCLCADTLARTIAAPAELPVGSITAIAGAPYFIYLLIVNRCKSNS